MTPKIISKRIVADRLDRVDYLLGEIRALPLRDLHTFLADRRTIWAAESCLRRSLEALFDTGRHILAKGYGLGISEYKEIASKLQEMGIFSKKKRSLCRFWPAIAIDWCIFTMKFPRRSCMKFARIGWVIWK